MARRARKSRAGLERWKHYIECLRLMNFSFNNVRLYPPTHQEVKSVITKLQEGLTFILQDQDDVGFGFMDEMLYIEGAMSIEETSKNEMLVDRFAKCRVKYMTLMKGVSEEDLLRFFCLMNDEAKKPHPGPPGEIVARAGIKTIHVVEAEVDDESSKSKLARRKTLLDWYLKAIGILKETQNQLIVGKEVDLKPLYRLADDLMATIRTKGYEPFLLLPILGRRVDPHNAHSVNTAIYSCALAEAYGLNSGQIQTLCVAALLHDIGRCIIPKEWIDSPVRMTVTERAIVAQHPTWSFLLLARNPEIGPAIANIGVRHHQRTLAQAAENEYRADLFHKIINVVDTYDRAAFRPYKYWKHQRKDRFLKHILHERDRWYEPTLAKMLVQLVGYYPIGCLVKLKDGRRAMVVRADGDHVARPKVYLFEAESPEPTEEGVEPPPVILDLKKLTDDGLAYENEIVAVLGEESGLDPYAILDRKKEYLLNFSLE